MDICKNSSWNRHLLYLKIDRIQLAGQLKREYGNWKGVAINSNRGDFVTRKKNNHILQRDRSAEVHTLYTWWTPIEVILLIHLANSTIQSFLMTASCFKLSITVYLEDWGLKPSQKFFIFINKGIIILQSLENKMNISMSHRDCGSL